MFHLGRFAEGEHPVHYATYKNTADVEAHINMIEILVDPDGIWRGDYYIDAPDLPFTYGDIEL